MNKRLLSIIIQKKGFTLIELLIALAIVAVVGTVLAATITQLIVVQAADKNHMEVVDQLQNAMHYINRDAQTAWPGKVDADNGSSYPTPLAFSGHSLILEWRDYTDPAYTPDAPNKKHVITYSVNNGELKRSETVDSGAPVVSILARDIDGANSSYSYNNAVLTIKLTSAISGVKSATETRTLQIKMRPTE
jgi:prepilin-type N-terminal cleavage/methylation domain-containing protein